MPRREAKEQRHSAKRDDQEKSCNCPTDQEICSGVEQTYRTDVAILLVTCTMSEAKQEEHQPQPYCTFNRCELGNDRGARRSP